MGDWLIDVSEKVAAALVSAAILWALAWGRRHLRLLHGALTASIDRTRRILDINRKILAHLEGRCRMSAHQIRGLTEEVGEMRDELYTAQGNILSADPSGRPRQWVPRGRPGEGDLRRALGKGAM